MVLFFSYQGCLRWKVKWSIRLGKSVTVPWCICPTAATEASKLTKLYNYFFSLLQILLFAACGYANCLECCVSQVPPSREIRRSIIHKTQLSNFQELQLSDIFHFSLLFIHLTLPAFSTVIFPRFVFSAVILLSGPATTVTAWTIWLHTLQQITLQHDRPLVTSKHKTHFLLNSKKSLQ